jgi:hypothetical protein
MNVYLLTLAFICECFALGTLHAVAQERRRLQVPKEIVQQVMQEEGLKEFVQLRPDGSAENLVAEQIDLNRDGEPELEIHGTGAGICGAANCVTWIYGKSGDQYQMLLDAGSIQRIEPQKTFTKGYRDIIASMHGSAWDSDLTLYKFDGKEYRRVGCFVRTYRYEDKRGRKREWKRPQITPVECVSEP